MSHRLVIAAAIVMWTAIAAYCGPVSYYPPPWVFAPAEEAASYEPWEYWSIVDWRAGDSPASDTSYYGVVTSPPGNTGLVTGATAMIPTNGMSGRWDFDGTDDGLRCETNASHVTATGGFGAWLNSTTDDNGTQIAMGYGNYADAPVSRITVIHVYTNLADRFEWRCDIDGSLQWLYQTAADTTDDSVDRWRRLDLIQDGNPTLYLDGVPLVIDASNVSDRTAWVVDATNSAAPYDGFAVGGEYHDGGIQYDWIGQQSIAQVWTNPPSAAQIYSNYLDTGVSLGVFNSYWANDWQDWQTSVVAALEFNNIVEDGSSNRWAVTQNAPTLVCITAPSGSNNGNGGADFDGSTDYVSYGDANAFSFTDGAGNDKPFSVVARVRADVWRNARIIGKYDNPAAGNAEWVFTGSSNTNIALGLYTDGSSQNLSRSSVADMTAFEGQWISVAATYDGSEVSEGINLYTNGALCAMTGNTNGTYTGMTNRNDPLEVGRILSVSGAQYYNGRIDYVWLFNRELSAAEIADIHDSTKDQ